MSEFETMKSEVLSELETVVEYIADIHINKYDTDKATIKKVRDALVDAKAYFEAMIDEITD